MNALAVTESPDGILKRRGIYGAAVDAEWAEYALDDIPGWRYPVYNVAGQPHSLNGKPAWRWKAADSSAKPKYRWLPAKPATATYYLLRDAAQAIKSASGGVYLASGEPDVLAYRAAGIKNAISFLSGEGSIPPNFGADLQRMGVTRLTYYPDLDDAGMKAASKLHELLGSADSPVLFTCKRLPGELGSKHDINWLWQDCNADAMTFMTLLLDASVMSDKDFAVWRTANDAPKVTPLRKDSMPLGTDGLPADFVRDILHDVERRMSEAGRVRWNGDGWSENFHCPFHDDTHASAGFNRESMSFKCFSGCESTNARDYGAHVDIVLADYFDKPLTVVTKAASSAASKGAVMQNGTAVTSDTADALSAFYEPSDVSAQHVLEMLRGERLPKYRPQPFPFTSLHRFGGFAEMLSAGKLVGIVGLPGGGKSSLAETIADMYAMAGEDSVVFSPEWTPEENARRRVQRYTQTQVTATFMARHELWLMEAASGVPEGRRTGKPLSPAQLEEALRVAEMTARWTGKTYHLKAHEELANFKSMIAVIRKLVEVKRAEGRTVRHLFVDYIQRIPGARDSWSALEDINGAIKRLCEEMELHGYILIQPSRGDARGARDGGQLDVTGGQGISDQQFNLLLTMKPHFDQAGDKLPFVDIRVAKNSQGRTGNIRLQAAWPHLSIVDKEIQMIEPSDEPW